MSERDENEERFQAWAAQQALGPQPRKYDLPSACRRRISNAIVIVLTALFWAIVLFGMVRWAGQAMAQPTSRVDIGRPQAKIFVWGLFSSS